MPYLYKQKDGFKLRTLFLLQNDRLFLLYLQPFTGYLDQKPDVNKLITRIHLN
jgi:hypothetical protein